MMFYKLKFEMYHFEFTFGSVVFPYHFFRLGNIGVATRYVFLLHCRRESKATLPMNHGKSCDRKQPVQVNQLRDMETINSCWMMMCMVVVSHDHDDDNDDDYDHDNADEGVG